MGGNSGARREKTGKTTPLSFRRVKGKNPLLRQKEKNRNFKRQTEKKSGRRRGRKINAIKF